jgi:hypothetical protein
MGTIFDVIVDIRVSGSGVSLYANNHYYSYIL